MFYLIPLWQCIMKINRSKFLDNIYNNAKKFEIIEEALDDAEIKNDNLIEFRPLKMEKIKNNYLRRTLMIILFPVYLVLTWGLTLAWFPFLYIIRCINIVVHLYNSIVKKWVI